MKQFTINGQLWQVSKCGNFVRLVISDSGWYALEMFNAAFRLAASKAK